MTIARLAGSKTCALGSGQPCAHPRCNSAAGLGGGANAHAAAAVQGGSDGGWRRCEACPVCGIYSGVKPCDWGPEAAAARAAAAAALARAGAPPPARPRVL